MNTFNGVYDLCREAYDEAQQSQHRVRLFFADWDQIDFFPNAFKIDRCSGESRLALEALRNETGCRELDCNVQWTSPSDRAEQDAIATRNIAKVRRSVREYWETQAP